MCLPLSPVVARFPGILPQFRDEPTNALDTEGVRLFKEIIRQEKERGATVLIASHSLEDFPDFCDTIIPMEAGRVVDPKGGSRIE